MYTTLPLACAARTYSRVLFVPHFLSHVFWCALCQTKHQTVSDPNNPELFGFVGYSSEWNAGKVNSKISMGRGNCAFSPRPCCLRHAPIQLWSPFEALSLAP